MPENAIAESGQEVRKAPPVSRTLRLLTGSWLLFETAINLHRPDWKTALVISGTFAAVFLYYSLVHRLLGQRVLNWMVLKAVSILPGVVLLVQVARVTDIQLGVLAFFGVSLVIQALLGDRGCEVMTLPTFVFRRPAHLPCLIFSPIDRFEESIYRAIRDH